MADYPTVIKKRIGFLAATALGISAVLVTCVVCGTVMVVYGLHVASDKAEGLCSLAERTVHSLPDMAKALPPALGDLVNDQRRPDYAQQIAVSAHLTPGEPGRPPRVVVEAANNGPEMITLLSVRVTVTDANGRIVSEANDWAASPFAADGPWRGPLLAGGVRRFTAGGWFDQPSGGLENLNTHVEITDIRIWKSSPDAPRTPEAIAEQPAPTPPALTGDLQM